MFKVYLLSLLIFVCYGCESIFFHPSKSLLYQPDICANQPANYYIETEDGAVLHSWYFKSMNTPSKGTIIFIHGNGGNMSSEVLGMLWLLDKGYNIFAFDYRGYGVSKGSPSIKGVLKDGIEALDGFMQIDGVDKNNLILYGQSLGGAVASYVAANSQHSHKIDLLVLDSTFTSWRSIAKETAANLFITWPFQYPISWFYPADMSSINLLKNSKIKYTLILHSKADKLIDVSNGEALFAVAKEPKELFIYDYAAHAAILYNKFNRQKIVSYFDKVLSKD